MKAVLIVLDSVGIGAAPDADRYGDEGSATLPHIAEAAGGLHCPTLQTLGLGCIPPLLPSGLAIRGIAPARQPAAHYGAMQPVSEGKDTTTGHWELAGLDMRPGFHVFPPQPPSFPSALTDAFSAATGRGILGNKAASGTEIIEELGAKQLATGDWICYTSSDSVFQIAAHNDVIPLGELYHACQVARGLCDAYRVGRVIARPFKGTPGSFARTEDRRDYSFLPQEPTILDRLTGAGIPVYAIGKIEDIFAQRGLTEAVHTGNTRDSQQEVVRFTREKKEGLLFANFIDFDMLYGHRRDPAGYARALEQSDAFLNDYLPLLGEEDLLVITADHGNDPTFKGTDHTREFVPLLAYRATETGRCLGVRHGFYDVARSLGDFFGLADPPPRGKSFLTAHCQGFAKNSSTAKPLNRSL